MVHVLCSLDKHRMYIEVVFVRTPDWNSALAGTLFALSVRLFFHVTWILGLGTVWFRSRRFSSSLYTISSSLFTFFSSIRSASNVTAAAPFRPLPMSQILMYRPLRFFNLENEADIVRGECKRDKHRFEIIDTNSLGTIYEIVWILDFSFYSTIRNFSDLLVARIVDWVIGKSIKENYNL